MIIDGKFYVGLTGDPKEGNAKYSIELKHAIEEAGEFCLSSIRSSSYDPGMLLGSIQSGKTRGFIGLMALCFDNDFDMAIILTKCSKALVQQTVHRMTKEFNIFHSGKATVGEVIAQDILDIDYTSSATMEDREFAVAKFLKRYRNKKRIIVVKKQADNVDRMNLFIKQLVTGNDYKRILIIDDEADITSIGYSVDKEISELTLRRISGSINTFRRQLKSNIEYSLIQVTATPYALYLQPEIFGNEEIQPIKPVKTIVMPQGEGYIGGKYYFIDSQDETMENYEKAKYLPHIVEQGEMDIINGSAKNSGKNARIKDRRTVKYETVLEEGFVLPSFRSWLFDILAGAAIIQLNRDYEDYYISAVLHAATAKKMHKAQSELVNEIINVLRETLKKNIHDESFEYYLKQSYTDLIDSVKVYDYLDVPTFEEVYNKVAYKEDGFLYGIITDLDVKAVNSDSDIMKLLDENGELRLETSLTIFVGGQVLDRGITIPGMISFFYGRDPKIKQQDTVVQHCRMLGYRGPELLSVTRFYTTNQIFSAMREITIRDEILRERIAKQKEGEVIYLEYGDKIRPCSPSKILASNVNSIVPEKRYLPVGFEIRTGKREAERVHKSIFDLISEYKGFDKSEHYSKGQSVEDMYVTIDPDTAITLIQAAYSVMEPMDGGTCNSIDQIEPAFWFSISEFISSGHNEIALVVRRNRKLSKYKRGGLYQDAPEDGNNEGALAKELQQTMPVLVMIEQTNPEWKYPFWWPSFHTPVEMSVGIYSETVGKETGENLYSVPPKPVMIDDFQLFNTANISDDLFDYLEKGVEKIGKYWNDKFQVDGAPKCTEPRELLSCPIYLDDLNESATPEEVEKRLLLLKKKAGKILEAGHISSELTGKIDKYFDLAIEETLTDEYRDMVFQLVDEVLLKKYMRDNLYHLLEEANNILYRKDEPFGLFIARSQRSVEVHIYLGTIEYYLENNGYSKKDLKVFALSTIAHELYHAIHFTDVTTESGRWLYTRRGFKKQVCVQESLAEYFSLCFSKEVIDKNSGYNAESMILDMRHSEDYPKDPCSGCILVNNSSNAVGNRNEFYVDIYTQSLSDMFKAENSIESLR